MPRSIREIVEQNQGVATPSTTSNPSVQQGTPATTNNQPNPPVQQGTPATTNNPPNPPVQQGTPATTNNPPDGNPEGFEYQVEQVAARAARRPGNLTPATSSAAPAPAPATRSRRGGTPVQAAAAPTVQMALFVGKHFLRGFNPEDTGAAKEAVKDARSAVIEAGGSDLDVVGLYKTITIMGRVLPDGERVLSLSDMIDKENPGTLNYEAEISRLTNGKHDLFGDVSGSDCVGWEFIPMSEKTMALPEEVLREINPDLDIGMATCVLLKGKIRAWDV